MNDLEKLKGTKEVQAYEAAGTSLEEAFARLTDQQRLYVDGRLAGLTPYAACKAAGYAGPESSAYRLERTPKVQDALAAASQVARVTLDMGKEDVLEGLMEALSAAANATEMTNVWKEVGKIIGVYQPMKLEVTHDIGEYTQDQLMRMSNKDLVQMAEQPGAIVPVENNVVDAEFEVLKEAVTPPEPIDYDNMDIIDDSTSDT